MEKIQLQEDIPLIGFRLQTFPDGIGAAFDSLMQKLNDGVNRSYYGISYCKEDAIVYWVMAEEKQEKEAEKHLLTRYILKKGNFHSVAIHGWQSKTDSVKGVFHTMMQNLHSPEGTHCIEWYKTDEEMFCMISE